MSVVPTNVGVFFGQVDKRSKGRYWADARGEKIRGTSEGHSRPKSWRRKIRSHACEMFQMGPRKGALRV
jgi:hypothetical protein